ncbi:Anaphase-promoting complex subunit 8, partial [Tetrabaena socialis]
MVPERGGGGEASVPSPATPADIALELTQAVHDLTARGLFSAAQWAAEQLVGLELHTSSTSTSAPPPLPHQHQQQHHQHSNWQQQQHEHQHQHQQHPSHTEPQQPGPGRPAADPDEGHPLYLLARAHFIAKEYRRCAHALLGLRGRLPTFLRLHATYLAGEKRREEERVEKGGPLGPGADSSNPELEGLTAALEAELGVGPSNAGGGGGGGGGVVRQPDPFLMYMYGVVLAARGRSGEALDALAASLRAYPCNWSAWAAVQSICTRGGATSSPSSSPPAGWPSSTSAPSAAAVASLGPPSAAAAAAGPALSPPADLPMHWTRDFFLAALSLGCHQNQEALSRLQGLAQLFRGSLTVEAGVAQAQYNLQNFNEAQALYEDLLARDPYRIEGTDTLSNILFVKEAAAPLSVLAHRLAATDKYRPETCCVLGNYYAQQGAHEKAVEYFRRALRLDPRCLAAWTLMGHEFMEIKNTPAAIDAYRRAIDVCPQDFRAWYGLGQAYELLKMPFYALYYYRRAAQLRPADARMWCALAQCYVHEQVGLVDAAIRAYQRAVAHNDPDGIAVHKLAKLYESRGELDAAERLFRHSLQRLEDQGPGALQSQDAVEALCFMAARCK